MAKNPETLFNQLLALDEISEKRIEGLLEALQSRIKDAATRNRVLSGLSSYIGGSFAYEKVMKNIRE